MLKYKCEIFVRTVSVALSCTFGLPKFYTLCILGTALVIVFKTYPFHVKSFMMKPISLFLCLWAVQIGLYLNIVKGKR
jgi:hypothetical protein